MQAYTINNFADNCDFEKLSMQITDHNAWFKTDIFHASFKAIHTYNTLHVSTQHRRYYGRLATQHNVMFNNQLRTLITQYTSMCTYKTATVNIVLFKWKNFQKVFCQKF